MLASGLTTHWMGPALAAAGGTHGGFAPWESLFKGAARGLELSSLAARAGAERFSKHPPSLPTLEAAQQGLYFADRFNQPEQQTAADKLQRELFGTESAFYGRRGLAQLVGAVGVGLWDYYKILGWDQLQHDYQKLQKQEAGNGRLEIHPQFFEHALDDYRHWLIQYAWTHRMNVIFEGFEQIPTGAPVVYVMAPHSTIYPDFLATIADRYLLPVAAIENFRNNDVARRFGFAAIADRAGFPMIDRENPADKGLLKYILSAAEHGVHPGFFVQSGRGLPGTFNNGEPAPAGLYSRIIKVKLPNGTEEIRPEEYIQNAGPLFFAGQMARKAPDKTAYIAVMTIEGADRVMPPVSHAAPYDQVTRAGQTVRFRVEAVMPYQAKQRQEANENIELVLRETVGTDRMLRPQVEEWAEAAGLEPKRVGEIFAQIIQDTGGVRYAIAANRILLIPRREDLPPWAVNVHPSREDLAEVLVKYLNKGMSPESDPVKNLLKTVTQRAHDIHERFKAEQKARSRLEALLSPPK